MRCKRRGTQPLVNALLKVTPKPIQHPNLLDASFGAKAALDPRWSTWVSSRAKRPEQEGGALTPLGRFLFDTRLAPASTVLAEPIADCLQCGHVVTDRLKRCGDRDREHQSHGAP